MFNHKATAVGGHERSPAIVHSTTIQGANLTVLGLHGVTNVFGAKEGSADGEWQWPADAEKTAEEEAKAKLARPVVVPAESDAFPKRLKDPVTGFERVVVNADDEANSRDLGFTEVVANEPVTV
jgi:hypothetical protein